MKKITVEIEDDNGDFVEHELPSKMEVCDRCEGHGTILNPSIGEHAYSMEEFMEAFPEEEDREHYFKRGGMYDVSCPTCKGLRVAPVVDEEACNNNPELKNLLEKYYEQEEDRASYERECAAEARMERMMCGDY